jgi:hypothetical protein
MMWPATSARTLTPELGKSIKEGDHQVEKAVEISIGREEDGYTVWFQGWPVEKIDTIISDKIDVDDLLRRTRQAIEDCLANLPGAED